MIDVSQEKISAWRNKLPSDIRKAVPEPAALDDGTAETLAYLLDEMRKSETRHQAIKAMLGSDVPENIDRARRMALLGHIVSGMTEEDRDRVAAEASAQQPIFEEDTQALLAATAHRVVRNIMGPSLLDTLSFASLELQTQHEHAQEAS